MKNNKTREEIGKDTMILLNLKEYFNWITEIKNEGKLTLDKWLK